MKLSKTICLIILSVFTIATLNYAHAAMVNLAQEQDTPAGAARVEGVVTDEQARLDAENNRRGKGSPMHAWIDIAGKKAAGDTFTREEFAENIRSKKPGGKNWSYSTIGLELQSLVNIGVLAPTGTQGEYRVLVTATSAQIDEINTAAIGLVGRRGIVEGKRGAVGIDAHRLDANWLGEGNIEAGNNILKNISQKIAEVTGTNVASVSREDTQDPVDAMIAAGDLIPAAVFINEERPFAIAGAAIESYAGVAAAQAELANNGEVLDTKVLLANLVNLGLLSDAVSVENNTGNFEPTTVRTVLFNGEFVTRDPEAFASEFAKLADDQIAVIIASGEEMETAINAALETKNLSGALGDKIIVMGVQLKTPAAEAFEKLFNAGGGDILRNFRAEDILNNKDAVEGLAGAV
ncbi:MAG: hypothetical protein Q7O04_04395 [Candidatus Omnitrophota bacterium]|nr:hypothetical protein [Candidatus Omnitrophota bacterium]